MKLKSLPGAYRLTVLWGRWTRLYQRVSIVGLEHVPLDGPLLIVSNHLSYFDPLLISAFFPRIIYWMAKPELFKPPFLRKVLINNYVFPAARGEKSDIFLKGVSGKIQKGQAVGIFIQGGIVKPGETKVAKKGAAIVATQSACPVLLVQIRGTRELYSWKALIPKLVKLSVKIRPASSLPHAQMNDEELFNISQNWLEEINQL
jgi:1-acyl-sn-glycerol-3-phosphate acyltransferase